MNITCKQCKSPALMEMGHLLHTEFVGGIPQWRDYSIENCLCGYTHTYWNDEDGEIHNLSLHALIHEEHLV